MLLSVYDKETSFEDVATPQLERLVALQQVWESKCKDGRLPSKADFPPEDVKPWLGHILLLDVSRNPARFRVRLMGGNLVSYAGTDFTGKWLDEVFDPE